MSICTEAYAITKGCPFAASHPEVSPYCIASECMAWRWYKQPETQATTRILSDQYMERAEKYGVAEDVKAVEAAYEACNQLRTMPEAEIAANEASWASAHHALVQAMADHQPPLEDFPRPGGEGWTPGTPEFFEDEEEWTLDWTRETDPKATGFCGACPVPPAGPALVCRAGLGLPGWIDPVKGDAVSLGPGKIVRGK